MESKKSDQTGRMDPPEAPNRKLAAILSADVVGYSRLMADDESATVRTLQDYREEIGLLVVQHRGRVVDTAGDSLLAEFPTATEAVRCALEAQGVLRVRNAALPEGRRMEFRIGVHVGEIRVEGQRIYGDGVNIAARLESLAGAGEICISGEVHDQIEGKLTLSTQDLGARSLKNIPKPVRVHRLAIGEPASDASRAPAAEADEPCTVAVLAFDNLSADAEQEYFADGLAEDLITRLSIVPGLAVIARNSSFTYKGRAVDVKQIGRELGARYVVEGSVRRGARRFRVSAQLIDAIGGQHLWAEVYDRDLQDLFDLQDALAEAIAGALPVALRRAEQQRSLRKEPGDLTAYDLVMRGTWHLQRLTPEDNRRARSLLEQATQRDPGYAQAFASLAIALQQAVVILGIETLDQIGSQLEQAARAAVALDPRCPDAHVAMAFHYSHQQDSLARSLASIQRALELNPNDGARHALLGVFHSSAGSYDEAIAAVGRAMRLSPRDPRMFLWMHAAAMAHYAANRFESALEWAHQSLRERPDFKPAFRTAAACCAELAREAEARAAISELLRLEPDESIARLRSQTSFLQSSVWPLEQFLDALRKAGLPEE